MAGEWIKMRSDLWTDPDVMRIAAFLKLDRFAVIGRLHAFWSWADRHSVDGRVDGGSPQFLDDIVNTPEFANALGSVGWVKFDAKSLVIPKFERHNGASAKQRALKNQRQARWRAGDYPQSTQASTSTSTPQSTNPSTREEKRRISNKQLPVLDTVPRSQPPKASSENPKTDNRTCAVATSPEGLSPSQFLKAAIAKSKAKPNGDHSPAAEELTDDLETADTPQPPPQAAPKAIDDLQDAKLDHQAKALGMARMAFESDDELQVRIQARRALDG